MITKEMLAKQLSELHQEGQGLVAAFEDEKKGKQETEPFESMYQSWYTKTLPLMKQLAADRYAEFRIYYEGDPDRGLLQPHSYAVQDYLLEHMPDNDGFDHEYETARCISSQLAILKAVADRLEWQRVDTVDQAGRSLQLAELETARDLVKISERAAGALAGTVLQTFLAALAQKHKLKFRKHAPSSRDYAEALKTANVLDVPVWSQSTWLAEIHDRCLRPEGEAPTKTQVRDLIDGVHWLITNVF